MNFNAGLVRSISVYLVLFATHAAAQEVAFFTSSLPAQMRQEGLTEYAGELALTAISTGTILAGSTIDVVYSSAITNNTSVSTGNVSLANNVACTSAGCPTGASLVGSQTVRLAFASDKSFTPGNQLHVSRVRVNANSALGAGVVTATASALSADPANNPNYIL